MCDEKYSGEMRLLRGRVGDIHESGSLHGTGADAEEGGGPAVFPAIQN